MAYDDGFSIPTGPPSPKLEFSYADDSVILEWEPGTPTDEFGNPLEADNPARSPEHHISAITGNPDFQGYRIWRYQAEDFSAGLPKEVAQLVGEYDVVDGIGFDTGLPPLNEDGKREFVDTNLLDGFPYWYSVTSFSAPRRGQRLAPRERLQRERPAGLSRARRRRRRTTPRTVGRLSQPLPGRIGVRRPPGDHRDWAARSGSPGCRRAAASRIFTLAGELVQTLDHDDPVQGQRSWDLLSEPAGPSPRDCTSTWSRTWTPARSSAESW